jgi:CDP-diacylglycerol--serine O-phosphatidyltransferase
MVSTIPVFSGKQLGKRIEPELVLPVVIVAVLFFALLISYPWAVLTIGTLAYLGSLPFGWIAHRDHARRDLAQARAAEAPAAVAAPQGPIAPGLRSSETTDGERPTRLN